MLYCESEWGLRRVCVMCRSIFEPSYTLSTSCFLERPTIKCSLVYSNVVFQNIVSLCVHHLKSIILFLAYDHHVLSKQINRSRLNNYQKFTQAFTFIIDVNRITQSK